MDYNNEQSAGPEGRKIFQTEITTNRPKCLAEGTIPWMASQIEWVPIDRLQVPTTQLRHHPKRQIKLLIKAIKEYGFTTPLLVDNDYMLVLGDGRLLAAMALEMDVVPVIRISHLTDRQIAALKLADNKIAELAEWNWDEVARTLEQLAVVDFDVELTGFSVTEADLTIARHLPKPHDVALDDCPPAQAGEPVAQLGDVFGLDEHRVGCGDCRDTAVLTRLMDDTLIAASFSDPPYNVPILGNVSGLGKVKHGEFAMVSGEMTDDQFFEFLVVYLIALRSLSRNGAVHYCCMDWRSLDILVRAIRHTGGTLLKICTWAKTNAGMGSFYRSQTEFIVVFQFGDAPHQNNVMLGANGRNRSNLWRYEGANSINPARRRELMLHPTVKPVRIAAGARSGKFAETCRRRLRPV